MKLLWVEFGALTLLVSFMIWRYWRYARQRAREEKNLPPGHGFNTQPVQARLNRLRQDYESQAALRPRRTPGHELIVAAVRRSLVSLSYFRSAQTKPEEPSGPGSVGRGA